jgi:hypothetical protein
MKASSTKNLESPSISGFNQQLLHACASEYSRPRVPQLITICEYQRTCGLPVNTRKEPPPGLWGAHCPLEGAVQ